MLLVLLVNQNCHSRNINQDVTGIYKKDNIYQLQLSILQDSLYYFSFEAIGYPKKTTLGIVRLERDSFFMINIGDFGQRFDMKVGETGNISVSKSTFSFVPESVFDGIYIKTDIKKAIDFSQFYNEQYYEVYENDNDIRLCLQEFPIESKRTDSIPIPTKTSLKMFFNVYDANSEQEDYDFFFVKLYLNGVERIGWLSSSDFNSNFYRLFKFKNGIIEKKED